jgi:hypothetical protein
MTALQRIQPLIFLRQMHGAGHLAAYGSKISATRSPAIHKSEELATTNPDAHFDELVVKVCGTTENWAKRHGLWHDSLHKDLIAHYNWQPGRQLPGQSQMEKITACRPKAVL